MQVLVLGASPRKGGNTSSLTDVFCDELLRLGHTVIRKELYELHIAPCTACRSCQTDWSGFGCPIADDAGKLFEEILACDTLVLASPIYSWYCTPPMKALLDRMVYGMNKFYGEQKGPSLWQGRQLAVITTCGYPPEKGADLWAEGMRRYCRHSRLIWRGMLAQRHLGYGTIFMDEKKEQSARSFARALCGKPDPALD